MSSATPSQISPPPADDKIDKDALYGRYQKHEDARDRLGIKMAYKALDIPEDDMNINVTHNNYPPTPLAPPASTVTSPPPVASLMSKLAPLLLGAGLTATGAGGAIGIPMLISAMTKTAATVPSIPAIPSTPQRIVEEWDSSVDMIVKPPAGGPK